MGRLGMAGSGSAGRPEMRGLCPLIQVFDMGRALEFYRDKLGFEVVQQSAEGSAEECDWVWIRAGSADLMLNTMYEREERPAAPPGSRTSAHADTGLFIGAPDVEGVYEFLRGRGVEVERPVVTGYGMKQLYVRDPDGYVVCFQWKAG